MIVVTSENTGKRIGNKISDLVQLFHGFPFVGMLLRTWISDMELDDFKIFEKTLKLYKNQTELMSKEEVESSYTIFTTISKSEREDYMALYKIITSGVD